MAVPTREICMRNDAKVDGNVPRIPETASARFSGFDAGAATWLCLGSEGAPTASDSG